MKPALSSQETTMVSQINPLHIAILFSKTHVILSSRQSLGISSGFTLLVSGLRF
jgi:hypothetical protein